MHPGIGPPGMGCCSPGGRIGATRCTRHRTGKCRWRIVFVMPAAVLQSAAAGAMHPGMGPPPGMAVFGPAGCIGLAESGIAHYGASDNALCAIGSCRRHAPRYGTATWNGRLWAPWWPHGWSRAWRGHDDATAGASWPDVWRATAIPGQVRLLVVQQLML
jgi:hypothetical protein